MRLKSSRPLTKNNRGIHRKPGAPALPGAGAPKKYITLRVPVVSGKIPIAIDTTTLILAQRLMLRNWPGVATVEDLVGYALRKLAEEAASPQSSPTGDGDTP